MKLRLVMLLLLLLTSAVEAQQLRVTFNVSANPSPYLSDWTTRRETAIVTIVNSDSKAYEVRLAARVLTNGELRAETKVDRMPSLTVEPGVNTFYGEQIIQSSAVTFHGDVSSSVARSGRLPSGSYSFCLRVHDAATLAPLSEEQCRPFRVQSYSAPRLLSPTDGEHLPSSRAPLTFTWTGISPRYSANQQYEIAIAEVHAGQSALVAYRANRPILLRTVATTRMVWPADVPLDTPMTYVWSVRAIDDAGNPLGESPDGWAEPSVVAIGAVDSRSENSEGGGGIAEKRRDISGDIAHYRTASTKKRSRSQAIGDGPDSSGDDSSTHVAFDQLPADRTGGGAYSEKRRDLGHDLPNPPYRKAENLPSIHGESDSLAVDTSDVEFGKRHSWKSSDIAHYRTASTTKRSQSQAIGDGSAESVGRESDSLRDEVEALADGGSEHQRIRSEMIPEHDRFRTSAVSITDAGNPRDDEPGTGSRAVPGTDTDFVEGDPFPRDSTILSAGHHAHNAILEALERSMKSPLIIDEPETQSRMRDGYTRPPKTGRRIAESGKDQSGHAPALLSSSTLVLELGESGRLMGRTLTLSEDLLIDEETCDRLGVEFLAIRKGTYVIDRSASTNGIVELTATTSSIEVELDGMEIEIVGSADPALHMLRRVYRTGKGEPPPHVRTLTKRRGASPDLTDASYVARFVSGARAGQKAVHKRRKSERHIVDCPKW